MDKGWWVGNDSVTLRRCEVVSGRSGWKSPPIPDKEDFEKQAEMFVVNRLGHKLYILRANIKVNYIFNPQILVYSFIEAHFIPQLIFSILYKDFY